MAYRSRHGDDLGTQMTSARHRDVLYVADTGNHRVQMLRLADGGHLGSVGLPDTSAAPLGGWLEREAFLYNTPACVPGAGVGQFNYPTSICVAGVEVYVVDERNVRIVVLGTDLTWRYAFGHEGGGNGEFRDPAAVAAHGGELYVVDGGNTRIQVFAPDRHGWMRFQRAFGSRGEAPGQFTHPGGVAFFRGLLLVSDYRGERLQVLSPTGVPLQQICGFRTALSGVCADEQFVWTSAYDQNVVLVFKEYSPCVRVCYISMLCEEGSREYDVTAASADGVDDGQWLAARLAEAGVADASYELTRVYIARGAALPDCERFDFFVLGGTFHSVHDGRPWQEALHKWLPTQRATGKPLLGICGGHQAMCVAAGGRVAQRPGGMAAGSLFITQVGRGGLPGGARHPLLAGISLHDMMFHFGNSDEVSEVPPGATVFATTADSPAVALDYGDGWRSVQFHPEASHTVFQHWTDAGLIGSVGVWTDDEYDRPPPPMYRPLRSGRTLLANFLERGDAGLCTSCTCCPASPLGVELGSAGRRNFT